jgi:hypothetical protein
VLTARIGHQSSRADGGISQAGRGTGEDESGQHVGLELGQLLGGRWGSSLPKIPDDRQLHVLAFRLAARTSL